jgi:hypothetical protein
MTFMEINSMPMERSKSVSSIIGLHQHLHWSIIGAIHIVTRSCTNDTMLAVRLQSTAIGVHFMVRTNGVVLHTRRHKIGISHPNPSPFGTTDLTTIAYSKCY